ncbi:hypothetical protein JVU11DRAFT_6060 [Chiua virens]|nr:hypothetical protein JVU11DRAFT_6060 [Chiua virens]
MVNIYFAAVVNPQTSTHYLALPRCLIAVGSDGNIIWIENDIKPSDIHDTIALRGLKPDEYAFFDYSENPGEFIMPGLIDTHVHACQFPNLGVGGDRELLDWLLETVFPTESKFECPEYAKYAYNKVIDSSIASGTTTSCYYGSLHLEATMILASIVKDKGNFKSLCKCNMDWNCPGYYIEKTPDDSIRDTIKLIEHIQSFPLSHANESLVHPIITPRFAVSCSEKLLTKLGELAASLPHVSIQTHISENRKEVEDVKRQFNAESYASVYDRFGLLRNNTILGHGVWLTEKEMELIAKRGAGVAHCPTSNFYLSSGMAKVGLLLDHGVKVGLGTDVGGGYNPSILYTIQMASTTSKMVAVQAELDEERRRDELKHSHRKHAKPRHCKRACDCVDPDACIDSDSDEGEEVCRCHRHVNCRRRERPPCCCHHHHHHVPPNAHPVPKFTNQKLTVDTLLYLATLGGAHLCNLGDRIGSFAVGKAFDALHVRLDTSGNPAVWGVDKDEAARVEENVRRWLERFLFGGDNRNVREVWVGGVLVGGADVNRGKVNGVGVERENEG